MGELRLVFWLVIGVFKLIAWIITAIFKALKFLYDKFVATGLQELDRRKKEAESRAPAKIESRKLKQAPAQPKQGVVNPTVVRARELMTSAGKLGELAAGRRTTERFVRTLDALVDRSKVAAQKALTGDKDQERGLQRDEALLQMVTDMVTERQTESLGDLLADTDALANASYAPIVEYCTNRRIPLSSDRAATIVGGDKIFFMSVDDPTGLAAIVVPTSFQREIIAWPAISHEIAHDFFRSVDGLPVQLHKALGLANNIAVPVFNGDRVALDKDLADVPNRTTLAWMQELFADAFGTMMLGPAYVETMAALFAIPDDPPRVTVIVSEMGQKMPRYEEHPPGHVRVVVACQLLGKMGYGKVADGIEQRWRKRHNNPSTLYVPLADGRYASVPEGPVIERAAGVAERMYMGGLACLRGQPMRSIPGLDFGPREHQQALRVGTDLAANVPVRPGDPRLLVAGAVLATINEPSLARDIYAMARLAIEGLDPGESPSVVAGEIGPVDADALREAFIVGELLGPPASRRALRQAMSRRAGAR